MGWTMSTVVAPFQDRRVLAAGDTVSAFRTDAVSIERLNKIMIAAFGARPVRTAGPNSVLATGAWVAGGVAAVRGAAKTLSAARLRTPPMPSASPIRAAIERRSRIGR